MLDIALNQFFMFKAHVYYDLLCLQGLQQYLLNGSFIQHLPISTFLDQCLKANKEYYIVD